MLHGNMVAQKPFTPGKILPNLINISNKKKWCLKLSSVNILNFVLYL